MIDPSVLRALQATGATVEMIIAAVEADAAVERQRLEMRRTKDAERQRKSRASRSVTVTPRDRSDAPPNEDNNLNPQEPSLSNDKPSPLPERVVQVWNDQAAKAGAREARGCPASRKRLVKLRAAEHGEATIFEMIANVAASDFHCGKGDRGWRANLDWTLEPKNFQKMLELAPARTTAKPSGPFDGSDFAELKAGRIDNAEFERRRSIKLAQAQPPPRRMNGGPREIGSIMGKLNIPAPRAEAAE